MRSFRTYAVTGRVRAAGASAVLLLATFVPLVVAQEPQLERGAVAAGLLVRQLDGEKRVLVIGAHPDDEDTGLLAALVRGHGAEAAYLSLTRGEGGQNLIGPELDDGLGLLRTGELLSARRLDGAGQFFTRAYDFGFSKSAEETFREWPRDSILSDVVWVIRTFRPQVIVSTFSGTPRDGHGQHQVAGIMAREAFDAAGDSTRFPEQFARGVGPWHALKLYLSAWRAFLGEATLAVETGAFDPLLGRSHFQLAMASRSRHRSQDMGRIQPAGPQRSNLTLVVSRASTAGTDASLFAGIDTTLAGLAATLPAPLRNRALAHVERYRTAVHGAAEVLNVFHPERAALQLAVAVRETQALVELASSAAGDGRELQRIMEERAERAQRALAAAASVVLDVRAADDILVPGQESLAEVELWNGGPFEIRGSRAALLGRGIAAAEAEGVTAGSPANGAVAIPAGKVHTWRFRVAVRHEPGSPYPSEPYFLRRARDGALYHWPEDPALWGRPLSPPVLEGAAEFELLVVGDDGKPVVAPLTVAGVATFRDADKSAGEFRRPILVLPAVSLRVQPRHLVWPLGERGPRRVSVTLAGEAPDTVRGRVRVELPAGWRSEPGDRPFELGGPRSRAEVVFDVYGPPNATAGDVPVRVIAQDARGVLYPRGYTVVDYPHIEPVPLFEDAVMHVRAFPVEVARGRRIGYVMGAGDEGPEAIRQLGLEVELIGREELLHGDLGRFNVIVLGVRAFEVRSELGAANARLLDYVRRGGVLLVQYNKYEYVEGGFAPYPVAMRRPHDRVTDERAPVTILEPGSPVFREPNTITAGDFDGWEQERGLYFLSEWDPRFRPLLEAADAGEAPKRGALLVAPVGEGLYVYTGLSFFRQLPAGVPGAYRLFANLLSLDPARWRAYVAGDGRSGNGGR
ncbi:MAG: PIG-L family deacetylase [Gemmatimonadetes bacterium]|nr:PIG-L family deacetylase [Gemmatimonadota bacterium]